MEDRMIKFIQNWISESKGIDQENIKLTENIFQVGYVDSLGLFRLIFEVESQFDIEVRQDDLFSSGATSIIELVQEIIKSAA